MSREEVIKFEQETNDAEFMKSNFYNVGDEYAILSFAGINRCKALFTFDKDKLVSFIVFYEQGSSKIVDDYNENNVVLTSKYGESIALDYLNNPEMLPSLYPNVDTLYWSKSIQYFDSGDEFNRLTVDDLAIFLPKIDNGYADIRNLRFHYYEVGENNPFNAFILSYTFISDEQYEDNLAQTEQKQQEENEHQQKIEKERNDDL